MTNARETLPPIRRPGSADPDTDGGSDLDQDGSNQPLPLTDENPDVGLSQKGTDEEAVLRRETEI